MLSPWGEIVKRGAFAPLLTARFFCRRRISVREPKTLSNMSSSRLKFFLIPLDGLGSKIMLTVSV